MEKDKAYRVTKGNTDGGILKGDILYIDSRNDDLILSGSDGGWYSKNEELQDRTVTDFQCEIADDYRIFNYGTAKGIILKSKIKAMLER